MTKPKLIRVTTVPISLDKLLEGQLHFMSEQYEVTAISAEENGYLQRIAEREKVEFYPIELTRAITPFADLKALWKMYRFLKKEKPLIVHSHTPKAGTVGMMAARLAGVPIRLHTVAGLPLMEVTGNKRKLLNAVEKITYACATKVLPNSEGLKKIIVDQGFCQENKLKVIGKGSSNGIDTHFFDPNLFSETTKANLRQKWNISSEDFVYVFVGRIVKDKGIIELIKAFSSITDLKTKLLLVGSFEQELDPLPQEILDEIQSNPRIIHVGWQSDVRPFLSISHVLTFPSYREGFPNVVMQAGAMKLPAIVTDINGCNEIITTHENGIIIPVKSRVELSDAMRLLLENKQLYAELKSKTRKIIEENYRREYIWYELQKFYSEEIK